MIFYSLTGMVDIIAAICYHWKSSLIETLKNINKTTTINADIHKAYFISDNYPTEFEHPYLKYIYIN